MESSLFFSVSSSPRANDGSPSRPWHPLGRIKINADEDGEKNLQERKKKHPRKLVRMTENPLTRESPDANRRLSSLYRLRPPPPLVRSLSRYHPEGRRATALSATFSRAGSDTLSSLPRTYVRTAAAAAAASRCAREGGRGSLSLPRSGRGVARATTPLSPSVSGT